MDGVVKGALVTANFYMKAFKCHTFKPLCFQRYVDASFLILPHGLSKLHEFVTFFNKIHKNIKFTMELEQEGSLPFLDILVSMKDDGSLERKVYRKNTHTNLYLKSNSHHHTAQKIAVLSKLVHRAKMISDSQHLEDEMDLLKATFFENSYG